MLQLGIRGLGIARFKFNPISWFLKGEPGAWYDPSDLTTLFQDSAGTTPVTAVEQPVGLMLDKSRGLALGAELVTNGDFSNGATGWTQSGTGEWIFTNGKAECTAGTGDSKFYQICFNTNKYYVLEFDLTYTSGILQVNNDGVINLLSYSSGTTSGRKRVYFYPSAGQTLGFRQVGFVGSIDNISVKQIAGNHAFQGDLTTGAAAKRPMLSARVNLLTKTEDFSDNVIWIKGAFTSPTAGKIVENTQSIAESSTHQCYQSSTVTATHYTASIQVKPAGRDWCAFRLDNGTAEYAYFNLTGAGSPGTISSVYTASSIDLLPDGYYKLTLTRAATGPIFFTVIMGSTGNNIVTYQGDGVSGYFVKNADLRPTNSGALLPPYQRVNTASDYDTVGFPLYLKANGTSSAMSTNSIDFTATDKMTVVTGVRKLSDATRGIIFEFGSAGILGGFFVGAPPAASDPRYSCQFIGTLSSGGTSSGVHVAPETNVITITDTISDSLVQIRINQLFETSNTTSQGTGNFGNYPLYLFARAGTSVWFNGQFYGAIIRGAQSDTASVTQTENYMATKTGITF